MIASVAKWGNSLAVRIPRETARQLSIEAGGQVELSIETNALVVRPIARRARPTLAELVARITPENRHEEIQTGPAVGNEF